MLPIMKNAAIDTVFRLWCGHMYSIPLGKSPGAGLLGGTRAAGIRECEYLWQKLVESAGLCLAQPLAASVGTPAGLLGSPSPWLPSLPPLAATGGPCFLPCPQPAVPMPLRFAALGGVKPKWGLPMVPLKVVRLVTRPVLPSLVKGTLPAGTVTLGAEKWQLGGCNDAGTRATFLLFLSW